MARCLSKQEMGEVERGHQWSSRLGHSPLGSNLLGKAVGLLVSISLHLSLSVRQSTYEYQTDSFTSLLGVWRGGGNGERVPYLEIALRWKDNMTHWLMSKELILPAYSISNFLLRFNFFFEIIILF